MDVNATTKDRTEAEIVGILLKDDCFMKELADLLSIKANIGELRGLLRKAKSCQMVKWGNTSSSPQSAATLSKLFVRLQYPLDWDYLEVNNFTNAKFSVPEGQYFRPASTSEAIKSLTTIEKKEISTMAKFFERKAFVNGKDISTMDKEAIFAAISTEETNINSLKGITSKPQVLRDEIKSREEGLAELVAYLDGQAKVAQ